MEPAKEFKVAAEQDFPRVMRTMEFQESIVVPYTRTIHYKSEFVGRDENGWRYETRPPLVKQEQYAANRYTSYEAKRTDTSNGPRYEIYQLATVVPGLKVSKDVTTTRIKGDDGRTLFTKEEVLAWFPRCEEAESRSKNIHKDGQQTPDYFGQYQSSLERAMAALEQSAPIDGALKKGIKIRPAPCIKSHC